MITRNLGMLLLAIWLILSGISALGLFSLAGTGQLMGLLAVAAGILILLKR